MTITITADAGSTKTDWLVQCDQQQILYTTRGINPSLQSLFDIRHIISSELLADSIAPSMLKLCSIDQLNFYGAGCTSSMTVVMEQTLREAFMTRGIAVRSIAVGSDIIGAAHSVCGGKPGIACILGTGSNSCVFDGVRIVSHTPSLGYVLGDEGSGAAIGKRLVNSVYKGILPHQLLEEFEHDTHLTCDELIRRVYREPNANTFLASLSMFIAKHIEQEPALQTMLNDEFSSFIERNIDPYRRTDLPVGAVGSIAWHYKPYLTTALQQHGYTVGMIRQAPLR